jgi:hypothetical protein
MKPALFQQCLLNPSKEAFHMKLKSFCIVFCLVLFIGSLNAQAGSNIRKNGSIVAEIDGDNIRVNGSIVAEFDGNNLRKSGSIYAELDGKNIRKDGSIYAEIDGDNIRKDGSIIWQIESNGNARKNGSIMYALEGYSGSETMKWKFAAYLLFLAD